MTGPAPAAGSAPAPAARRRALPGLGEGTPLRVRLVAGLLVLVALGLLVAGAVATSALRTYLLGRVDDQLQQAQTSPVVQGDRRVGRPGRVRPFQQGLSQYYVAAVDGDALDERDRPPGSKATPDPAAVAQLPTARPGTVGSATGDVRWRALKVQTDEGPVVLAADLADVDQSVRRLVLIQVLVGAGVLALLAGLAYVLVRRSLRGLVEVEEAAAAVAAGDLSRRVPARDRRTEIGSLAASFNAMVQQVQSAFVVRAAAEERLRRFVADASHELRTPLTSIRGFAELHRQGAVRDPEDVARLMGRIEGESQRMGQLVEDLLMLARLDQHRPLALAPVDLRVLAEDAVHDAQALRPDRSITLDSAGPVVVRGDEARLRQVLGNLVGNALAHAPAPAPVAVRVAARSGQAVLEVRDGGPGMSPEVAGRVFERFFRSDASRTRASGGSGLGLAIVSSLVAAHHGRVELDTAPGRGATFRVLLPTA